MERIFELIKKDLMDIEKGLSSVNTLSLSKEEQQVEIFVKSCAVNKDLSDQEVKEIWNTVPSESLSPALNSRISSLFNKQCISRQKDSWNIDSNKVRLAFRKNEEPLDQEEASKVSSAIERARQKMQDRKK
ncbi:hypothetical protein KL86SPO_50082 [uncultured Sporomusa sp.]|uniref:Uncharacterized protein n=1 Tax=uncultured Sporomusa sp. TaxID=307249 RepID=A0A212LXR0_9FIRM|nr:hypothetical protein [uncultured Sporomusa sp.]SCM82311.1 hypothetical protein KL86SPO_50082 [uncultured Sporomusa sp.]